MQDLRCIKCNKLLGKYRDCKQLEIKCPRCGQRNLLHDKLPVTLQTSIASSYCK